LLSDGVLGLQELTAKTGLSKNAVVNHLTQLIGSGFVRRETRGRYCLTREGRSMLEAAANIYLISERRQEEERFRLRSLYAWNAVRGVRMEKKVIGRPAEYQPCWISYNGAMAGCIRSLGVQCDVIDVGGFSGYSFMLNVSKGTLHAGGPTAFLQWDEIMKGTENIGVKLDHWAKDGNFPAKQNSPTPEEVEQARKLFEMVKAEIDAERPVVLWGLHAPEYGIVNGYDGSSYLVSTFRRLIHQPDSPVVYYDLNAMGCLDMYRFRERLDLDKKVRMEDTLKRALLFAKGEFKTMEGFISGPSALTHWADGMESGRPDILDYFGISYMAQCYSESREICTVFTKRLAREIGGKRAEELNLASEEYGRVLRNFTELCKEFPFPEGGSLSAEKCRYAARLLRDCRPHEESAIKHLERALRA